MSKYKIIALYATLTGVIISSCFITHAYDNKPVSMQDVCKEQGGTYTRRQYRVKYLVFDNIDEGCRLSVDRPDTLKPKQMFAAKELNP